MMSYNIYYEHYACSVTDAIVFPLFSVLVWTGENNSKVWTRIFFENGGKKSPFQKYLDTCGRGRWLAKTLCVHHAFWDTTRLRRAIASFRFKQKTTISPDFLYLTWTSFIEILLQQSSPTFIWQSSAEHIGITSLRFQRTQSHFLSDVLTTIRLVS